MTTSLEATWAYRELLRIDRLKDADVIHELCRKMNGNGYSWKSIGICLSYLDATDIIRLQWQDLCTIKKSWDSFPSLARERQYQDVMQGLSTAVRSSTWNPGLFRTLLLDLRLILIRAGFEEEQAIRLVSQNLDANVTGAPDLWIEKEPWTDDDVDDERTPLINLGIENPKNKWF